MIEIYESERRMYVQPSAAMTFAKFLHTEKYDTRMWENGYTMNDVNGVCHALTTWGKDVFGLTGDFVMIWAVQDGIQFSGDSELAYVVDGRGFLLPNPFIEGDAEGFVVALAQIVQGDTAQLYAVTPRSRVLYNAV